MALKSSDRKNFSSMMQAAMSGDLCVVETKLKETGEYRAIVCMVNYDPDHQVKLVPVAEMITDDPYEIYEDPTLEKDNVGTEDDPA